MNTVTRTSIALLPSLFFTALLITGCSSTPEQQPQRDPYNQSDAQKSDAKKAQDELTRETSK